jgi:hypothetical protein
MIKLTANHLRSFSHNLLTKSFSLSFLRVFGTLDRSPDLRGVAFRFLLDLQGVGGGLFDARFV